MISWAVSNNVTIRLAVVASRAQVLTDFSRLVVNIININDLFSSYFINSFDRDFFYRCISRGFFSSNWFFD